MTFTLPPAPPAPTEMPDLAAVDEWSLSSMGNYLALLDRHAVAVVATRADKLVADGARHHDVMMALAAAEGGVADDERHLHAARTDAYAEHYGLRGWYRYTDHRGKHRVQVNLLRTPDKGDVGRYFVHASTRGDLWVVDRDTGATAGRAPYRHCADEWIARAEGTPIPALPDNWPLPVPRWTDRNIRTVELAGVTR